MFNMVAGVSPELKFVLGFLGFTTETRENFNKIPRFRDAYVIPGEPHRLVIMTRTGGGNRADYAEENEWMKTIPGYVEDYDDDFDSTFAHWVYDVKPEFVEPLNRLVDNARELGWDFPTPMQRMKRSLGEM
jgi:hypothetical protein